ncbi:Ribosomal_protein [Hexamita inflata]|uniref:Ribosomal protein n=1 Tax=Hexamita inflata TaxID=28002 RepID=A0AA86TPB5_9EUKA|nr:Ribosomal protein [Hexamita inflata]
MQKQMMNQVQVQIPKAYAALQKYCDKNFPGEDFDQHYTLDIKYHNIDLNAHAYPMQLLQLPHQVYSDESRCVFVLPNGTDKKYFLQLELEDLMIMNNQYEKRSEIAKQYDIFFIDESLKESVLRAGGSKFLQKATVVFIPNLLQKSEQEAKKFTMLPNISGQQSSIIVGNKSLSVEQFSENFCQALTQLANYIPYGLVNVQQVQLNRKIQLVPSLPLYISVKKAGQSLVKNNEEALDEMFNDVLQMALDEGFVSESEAQSEREKAAAGKKKPRVM